MDAESFLNNGVVGIIQVMADEILVINVGGYIGTSTRSKIEYAIETGKAIWYCMTCRRQPQLCVFLI